MSDLMEHPALAELWSRAGASDENRPVWLAERRGGVTATEIRELYLRGAAFKMALIEQKLGRRADAFTGNRYTAWGKTREPIIAAWAQQRFMLAPESRVFHAGDNPRFLASPDGVGVNFDSEITTGEYKTGQEDLAPGTEAFKAKGYRIQMMWVMRVLGARRCLYAWEQHDSDWQDRGGEFYEPAGLHDQPRFAWIEYDADLAAELEAIAVDFLAALDAAAAEGEVPIDEELDTLAVNVLRFREDKNSAKKAKQEAWDELLVRLEAGEPFTQTSPLARITYTPGEAMEEKVPDVDAAKAADPDLFEAMEAARQRWNEHLGRFSKAETRPAKPTLTITSVKPPREKK